MADKKNIQETITLPEGTTAQLDKTLITLKGTKGELKRDFRHPIITIKLQDNLLILTCDFNKKSKRMLNTYKAHIHNMIQGVTEGFVYTLKACSGHFPMNIKVEQDKVVITNFLGEKIARVSKILPGTKVILNGQDITVEGLDIEATGQTAANLEKATHIKGRDKRVFQDGCYITNKPHSK